MKLSLVISLLYPHVIPMISPFYHCSIPMTPKFETVFLLVRHQHTCDPEDAGLKHGVGHCEDLGDRMVSWGTFENEKSGWLVV